MGADGQCLEGERVGEKRLERVETRVGHHKDKATGESKSPDTACHVAFKIVDFAHSSCHPHTICTVPSMIGTHHVRPFLSQGWALWASRTDQPGQVITHPSHPMLLSVSFLCGKTEGKMTLSTFQDQDEMYGILKNINIKDKKTINCLWRLVWQALNSKTRSCSYGKSTRLVCHVCHVFLLPPETFSDNLVAMQLMLNWVLLRWSLGYKNMLAALGKPNQ